MKKSIIVDGKEVSFDYGQLAQAASGSCLVQIGETAVLATVVHTDELRQDVDFLPLTVDYRERTYAAGKIPGGFFKREGRPSEREILISRLIDRSLRPLFPDGWFYDTQITVLALSADGENPSDIPALLAAAAALEMSDIPLSRTMAGGRFSKVGERWVINPLLEQQQQSRADLVVSATEEAIVMVEAGASEMPEKEILQGLEYAHQELKKIIQLIKTLPKKEKIKCSPLVVPEEIASVLKESYSQTISEIVRTPEKSARENKLSALKKEASAMVQTKFPDNPQVSFLTNHWIEEELYTRARQLILKEKVRTDGRKFTEIRPIDIKIDVLPRTHGTAMFKRGQTQALVTVTLGTPHDMQIMDVLEGEYKERFMFHYNFPGFATGEVRAERGPGRREIGHGALAKRALYPLLPDEMTFPYTIRIVSDILESNGSSSMASVCGGSLALFAAGVPLKSAVAGVAMGLVSDGQEYAILTDIMGMEDHLGDMDFKVAGTEKGITALQMDIKISGLPAGIMAQALEEARVARLKILQQMNAALPKPNSDISVYAPRLLSLKISRDKIGDLIGPGGKNIRRIIEETGAEIDVEDDGTVTISSVNKESMELARQMVEYYTADVEVGKVYRGKVTRLTSFGAFVEILPGKEGLVRTSQLTSKRINRVDEVVKEGQDLMVKVIEIDSQGRVNLSHRAVGESPAE